MSDWISPAILNLIVGSTLETLYMVAKGPYVNLIAVRAGDTGKPWVKTLVESYRSPEVKAFILDTFKGAVLPSW